MLEHTWISVLKPTITATLLLQFLLSSISVIWFITSQWEIYWRNYCSTEHLKRNRIETLETNTANKEKKYFVVLSVNHLEIYTHLAVWVSVSNCTNPADTTHGLDRTVGRMGCIFTGFWWIRRKGRTMGEALNEALNENSFRNHSLDKNRCCSLAVRAKPPVCFSDISGNKWPRQVANPTLTICVSNQSQGRWVGVCVSPGPAGRVGRGGVCEGTAPPAGEPPATPARGSGVTASAETWSPSAWAGLSSGNTFSGFPFTFLFIGTSFAAGYLSTTSLWREEG